MYSVVLYTLSMLCSVKYTFHVVLCIVWFYVHFPCCVVYSLVLCTLSAQMRRLCLSRNPSEIWTVVGLNIAKKAIRSRNRAAQKSKGQMGPIFKKGWIPLQHCKRWQFGWEKSSWKTQTELQWTLRSSSKNLSNCVKQKKFVLLNLAGHYQATHLTRCLLCLFSPHFESQHLNTFEKCLPFLPNPAESLKLFCSADVDQVVAGRLRG